jgi:hypothetical protein
VEKRENAIKSDEIANLNKKMAGMELKMAEMAKNAEKKALSRSVFAIFIEKIRGFYM